MLRYVSRALQKTDYTAITMEGLPSGGVTISSLNNVMLFREAYHLITFAGLRTEFHRGEAADRTSRCSA